jgi:hypothetical protein
VIGIVNKGLNHLNGVYIGVTRHNMLGINYEKDPGTRFSLNDNCRSELTEYNVIYYSDYYVLVCDAV